LKENFLKILSQKQVLDSTEAFEIYGKDWIKDYVPDPSLILLPSTTEEVQKILRLCSESGIKAVPSGGRTGLSGGATAINKEVVICLDRLNKIIEINELEQTVTCQAGVLTQVLQEQAAAKGLFFPVDFSSKGTSQIGGNIATNAGGIRVVRYGNMRDWVLGLKIVTAGGEIIELNGSLYKNQTGYDLRNLIIGSEGTLAVIVEATLKLTKPPANLKHIICGLGSVDDVMKLFLSTRRKFPSLSVFEYFSRKALEEVLNLHSLKEPLKENCAHYALIEIEENSPNFSEAVEMFLAEELENACLIDAVLSQNSTQSTQFITYRELIPETLNSSYTLHKNDLSLPIGKIPAFINDLENLIVKLYPSFKVIIFGHIGDGNLHVNVLKPIEMDSALFYAQCKKADAEIFKLVQQNKGSISAEHGIGLLKKDFLSYSRTPAEISLMKQIKKVFDPKNTLNPGKIFD
jgi:glycolate oxidase subunit GlcD